jgi:hypothetical protein
MNKRRPNLLGKEFWSWTMNNATLLGFALFGHQDPPRFVFRSKHTSMGLISATGGGLFEPPTKGLRG